MGYPIFGKVRTIVLPLINPGNAITLDQYKEMTGIDLKEILLPSPDSKTLIFKDGNYQILINTCFEKVFVSNWLPAICSITDINRTIYESGVSDCILTLDLYSSFRMIFTIDKDDDFSIENVKYSVSEI